MDALDQNIELANDKLRINNSIKENLITAPEGTNLVQAEEILQNYKIDSHGDAQVA